jgi:hypothetical protein
MLPVPVVVWAHRLLGILKNPIHAASTQAKTLADFPGVALMT